MANRTAAGPGRNRRGNGDGASRFLLERVSVVSLHPYTRRVDLQTPGLSAESRLSRRTDRAPVTAAALGAANKTALHGFPSETRMGSALSGHGKFTRSSSRCSPAPGCTASSRSPTCATCCASSRAGPTTACWSSLPPIGSRPSSSPKLSRSWLRTSSVGSFFRRRPELPIAGQDLPRSAKAVRNGSDRTLTMLQLGRHSQNRLFALSRHDDSNHNTARVVSTRRNQSATSRVR
jgi:hypothetical protein